MTKQGILDAAKHLSIKQNVSIQVIDRSTGKIVQEHTGHNQATNSMLFGIAHHLIADFMPNERHGLNPGYSMLSNYVPRYISLGTIGLINQDQDDEGLPAGIGDFIPDSTDPEYQALEQAVQDAKYALDIANEAMENECPYWPATEECEACTRCSTRIRQKKQAVEDAERTYNQAKQALLQYNEEARFVEYMKHAPGYGADGYSALKNNSRKWFGLGWPWTSYDVTSSYKAETGSSSPDYATYNGILYKCIKDTSIPARAFDPNCWEIAPDALQPSPDFDASDPNKPPVPGPTINMELISSTYPRNEISFRDVVPESEAEIGETIDIVFSALISTGALKQFRPEGQDYLFITEAGLWSKKTWSDGDENGLLAGYRIGPPNEENWDMTKASNRKILKENILKVGVNQVVQVVWKIQIGSIKQFVQSVSPEPTPPTPSPEFHDIYYTTGVESSGVLNKLFLEKLPSNSRSVYFEEADEKRGCLVNPTMFDCDEDLYLDFVVNDDNTETIYWWTAEGEVNYRTRTTDPFYNLTMITQDMTKWHFLGVDYTYLPNEYADDFAELLPSSGYYTPALRRIMQFYKPETGYYSGYYIGGDFTDTTDYIDASEIKQYPTSTIPTSMDEYPIYVVSGDWEHSGTTTDLNDQIFYTCEADPIGFLDNNNIHTVMDAFYTCLSPNDNPSELFVDLFDWDYSRVTNMDYLFASKESTELTRRNADPAYHVHTTWQLFGIDSAVNVTSTKGMFQGSVDSFDGIFNGSVYEIPEGHSAFMDVLANVTDASYMFSEFNGEFSNIYRSDPVELPNVENVSHMFDGANPGIGIDPGYYLMNGAKFIFGSSTHESEYPIDATCMLANINADSINSGWFTFNREVDASYMFYHSTIANIHLYDYEYDFAKYAVSMSHMFEGADLNSGTGPGEIDANSNGGFPYLTDTSYMFSSVTGYDGSQIRISFYEDIVDATPNLLNMEGMFYQSESIDPDNYSTTNYELFTFSQTQNSPSPGAHDYTGYSINWDVSSVTNFSYTFYQLPCSMIMIPNWDCSGGTNFNHMFHGALGKTSVAVRDDYASSTGTHSITPYGSGHNGVAAYELSVYVPPYEDDYISYDGYFVSMQVSSNATSMESMFENARGIALPLDLSEWDVRNVTNVGSMFKGFTSKPIYYYYSQYVDGEEYPSTYYDVYVGDTGYYATPLNVEHPNEFYIKLPSFNFSNLTTYNHAMDLCSVPKVVLNNIHVDSVSTLNKIKAFFADNHIYYFEAKNWTFDPSITDLSNFFTRWRKLCAIDLSGWDVSHITNFRQMFSRLEALELGEATPSPGVIDYSSLDDWDISSGVDFYEMCGSVLHCSDPDATDDDVEYYGNGYPVPCCWFNEKPQERSYRFPDWDGTWDTTGLDHYESGEFSYPYYGFESGSYGHSIAEPKSGSGFGTFTPATPSRFVTLSASGINQLRSASSGNSNFLPLETGYETDILEYHIPMHDSSYYYDSPDSIGETAEEFIAHATPLDTTNPATKVYYDNGLYYCDATLQFTDLQNFKDILDALPSNSESVSFRNWDAANLTSLDRLFYQRRYRGIGIDMTSTESITNLHETFGDMDYLSDLFGLKEWNTENVTTMNKLFSDTYSGYFYGDTLEDWDLSSLTNLSYAFSNSIVNPPTYFDTSNVTTMEGTFKGFKGYSISTLELHWDTSSVVNMSHMFEDCQVSVDASSIDTSSVTNMSSMFKNAESISTDVSSWDVSNVTNMSRMFQNFGDIESDLYFSSWDTSSVYDMSYMFATGQQSSENLSRIHGIENWDVSSVSDFSFMFSYGYNDDVRTIPSGVITDWNMSSLTTVSGMFDRCNLSNHSSETFEYWLDPSGYFTCESLFRYATLPSTYSQSYGGYIFDISSWDISLSTNSCSMFEYAKFGNVAGTTILILPEYDKMCIGHGENTMTNFFQGTDIDKLICNNLIINSNATINIKEMLGFTGTPISDCTPKFNTIVAQDWNVSGSLSNLFSHLHYLRTIQLSRWEVSGVTDFSEMFYKSELVTIPPYEPRALPGVLDFSTLDDWTNIDTTANFTRMCASNLDDEGSNGYHAFEQGYRFPNWSGGTWDTTGLQVVHIDQANYPYYYSLAHEEYDAYCFGTQVVDGVVRLINKPPANSTFGTFIPQSTSWDYDWDFTSSLVDTEQSANLTFADNTTTPATGEWVQGTGIRIQDTDGKNICVPATLFVPGTVVEFDVTDCTMYYRDWADSWIIGNLIGDSSQYIGFITADEDYGQWGFSADWYTFNPTVEHAGFVSLGVEGLTYFANSTFKIESDEGANGKLVLKFYKDNTLLATTPELNHNNTDFLPKNNTNWEFFLTVSNMEDVTITGLRIRNGSQS